MRLNLTERHLFLLKQIEDTKRIGGENWTNSPYHSKSIKWLNEKLRDVSARIIAGDNYMWTHG